MPSGPGDLNGEKLLIAQEIFSSEIIEVILLWNAGCTCRDLSGSVLISLHPGKWVYIRSSRVSAQDSVHPPSSFLRKEGLECSLDRILLSLAESLRVSIE